MNDLSRCPTDGDIGLMTLLVTAGRLSEAKMDSALSAVGLTFMKWRTLDLLVRSQGPLSMKALVDSLGCVKSNVTPLVDKLEAGGIVRRLGDPKDRRTVLVDLSDAGRSLHKAGQEALSSAANEMVGQFSHEDSVALRRLVGMFNVTV